MEKVTRVAGRLDMLDTLKKKVWSTAHTPEKHGLKHNYTHIVLKNTTN